MSKKKSKISHPDDKDVNQEGEDDFDYSLFSDKSDYEDADYEEDLDENNNDILEEESAADWFDE